MANDKRIDSTVIDATYIGKDIGEYIKETQYRLRALRSKGGLVKIRTDKPLGQIHVYGSDAHFESSWINVKKVAIKNWE
jgi:hypothetical protein|tara:strand:- start:2945 stop:3181 length:237 start_codon:yes stop_codon:yes gene_type:complete